jgi:hypothetical protein
VKHKSRKEALEKLRKEKEEKKKETVGKLNPKKSLENEKTRRAKVKNSSNLILK